MSYSVERATARTALLVQVPMLSQAFRHFAKLSISLHG
jgi:hypothetical protein